MAKNQAPSFFLSIRFLLALIAFVAYATQYTQKINMSVAIVCMVNNTALKETSKLLNETIKAVPFEVTKANSLNLSSNAALEDKCGASTSGKSGIDGEFIWNKKVQGMILSSYFFGYLITEIPGGYLSMKIGPKMVLALSVLVSSIFTIALPWFARFSPIALSVCRFIIGAAHGVIWPAFAGFWASWAPSNERSRLIGTGNAGAQIGNVIALPLGGFLCINGFDGGWPSIFYVFGVLGLVWTVIWFVFASNSPEENRFIGEAEKEYILEETKNTRSSFEESESGAPWCAIMKSIPAWAIFIGHSCSNWGTYLFLTSLPLYMKEVLKFDIKSNGALSALPYLVFWAFILLAGNIGDYFLMKLKWSKTKVRKIFNSLAFFVPMLAVLGLAFVTCEIKYVGVALLTVGLAFTGCAYGAGFLVNYNDISGSYSGVVFGIGNTFATIPGIIAPSLVGLLTKNNLQEEWRIVFIITAVVYLIGAIVLLIFSSGELEPWAQKNKKNQVEEELPLRA